MSAHWQTQICHDVYSRPEPRLSVRRLSHKVGESLVTLHMWLALRKGYTFMLKISTFQLQRSFVYKATCKPWPFLQLCLGKVWSIMCPLSNLLCCHGKVLKGRRVLKAGLILSLWLAEEFLWLMIDHKCICFESLALGRQELMTLPWLRVLITLTWLYVELLTDETTHKKKYCTIFTHNLVCYLAGP